MVISPKSFLSLADAKTFVQNSEQEFEKRLELTVEKVCENKDIRLIGLSGPTCSGKTTTAKKLISRLTELGKNVAEGTKEELDKVVAGLKDGSINVFDTANFTVGGETLTSYMADVDFDAEYTKDTEVIEDGVFMESKFRSGPYFDLEIDGITLLDRNYG